MQKVLITLGVVFIFAGLAWPWLKSLPLGQLPGDIAVEKENYRFYFPVTTMIIVSVVLSVLVWIFRR